jgi:hypothetical protein
MDMETGRQLLRVEIGDLCAVGTGVRAIAENTNSRVWDAFLAEH